MTQVANLMAPPMERPKPILEFPRAPTTVKETGLPEEMLVQLLVKTLFTAGELTEASGGSSGDHFWVFHKGNLSASSSLLTCLSRCYQPSLPTPFPSPLKAADCLHVGSVQSHGFHRA